MMKACNFPGARVIGKPRSWDDTLDGECGSIFVADAIDTLSGQNFMYSVYQPTAQEIEALRAGGVIRLGIMGRSHPVFNLGVLSAAVAEASDLEPKWDLGPVIGE